MTLIYPHFFFVYRTFFNEKKCPVCVCFVFNKQLSLNFIKYYYVMLKKRSLWVEQGYKVEIVGVYKHIIFIFQPCVPSIKCSTYWQIVFNIKRYNSSLTYINPPINKHPLTKSLVIKFYVLMYKLLCIDFWFRMIVTVLYLYHLKKKYKKSNIYQFKTRKVEE